MTYFMSKMVAAAACVAVFVLAACPARAGEVRRLVGHTDAVMAVAFSPDGKLAASASSDKTVRIWDLATGKQLQRLDGMTTRALTVAFSSDGLKVAGGGMEPTLRVWDVKTGALDAILKGHARHVHACDLSGKAGAYFAVSVSCDKTTLPWDVKRERLMGKVTFQGDLKSVAFSPAGDLFAVGVGEEIARKGKTDNVECKVSVYETRTGKSRLNVELPGEVRTVAFVDGGRKLVAHYHHNFRIFDVATWKPVEHKLPDAVGRGEVAAVSPDGRRGLVATRSRVRLVDLASGAEVMAFAANRESVRALAFSPDGKRALIGGGGDDITWSEQWEPGTDHEIRVWDLTAPAGGGVATTSTTGPPAGAGGAASLSGGAFRLLRGQKGRVGVPAVSPDGGRILAFDETTTRLWDMRADLKEPPPTLDLPPDPNAKGGYDGMRAAAFSADGTRMAGGRGKDLAVWDAVANKQLFRVPASKEGLRSIAFSPDGNLVAGGSGFVNPRDGKAAYFDCAVRVWDVSASGGGKLVRAFENLGGEPDAVAFSPDGQRVIAALVARPFPGVVRGVLAFDVGTGKEVWRFPTPEKVRSFKGLAVSPGGAVAVAWDDTVHLLRADTGAAAARLDKHPRPVLAFAFSADGGRVLTVGEDKLARLWDPRTGALLGTRETLDLTDFNARTRVWPVAADTWRLLQTSQEGLTINDVTMPVK